MARYSKDEIERAFRRYWYTGAVCEDWDSWVNLLTEDITYFDYVFGTMRGRAAVRRWIGDVMEQYAEIYTVYDWHTIDEETGRVTVRMLNRRDQPSGQGTLDFPGVSILTYGGDGQFAAQEDFFAVQPAFASVQSYAEACAAHDPDHQARRTRLNWGAAPAWARGGTSYAERPGAADWQQVIASPYLAPEGRGVSAIAESPHPGRRP